jgi:hypothetical protein
LKEAAYQGLYKLKTPASDAMITEGLHDCAAALETTGVRIVPSDSSPYAKYATHLASRNA